MDKNLDNFQLENTVVLLTLILKQLSTLTKIHNSFDDDNAYLEYLKLAIKETPWLLVLIKG